MGKKYFILNTEKKGCGVAKIFDSNGKPFINFDIKNNVPLNQNEIFKGYIYNGSRFALVGSMETCKESFPIDKNLSVDGVAVVRKNLKNETTELEFWAGADRKIKELALSLLGMRESGDQPVFPIPPQKEQPPPIKQNEEFPAPVEEPMPEIKKQVPDIFGFEDFFGGGFEWQRIGGYFSLYNYAIIHHVLAGRHVYEAINDFGFYYSGRKDDEGIQYIATAVPVLVGVNEPFDNMGEYVYRIEEEGYIYNVICVGIDRSGEFFVEL